MDPLARVLLCCRFGHDDVDTAFVVVGVVGVAKTARADDEVVDAVPVKVASSQGIPKVCVGFLPTHDDIGMFGTRSAELIAIEDIRAALGGVVQVRADREVVGAVCVVVTGGKRDAEAVAGGLTGQGNIGAGGVLACHTTPIEDIRTALGGVVPPRADREVVGAVGVVVTGGKRPAEVVAGGLAGQGDISAGGVLACHTTPIEDIRTALEGVVLVRADREVVGAVSVVVTGCKRDAEVVAGGLAGQGNIGAGGVPACHTTAIEDIRAALVGVVPVRADREVVGAVGVVVTGGKRDAEGVAGGLAGKRHIGTGGVLACHTTPIEDIRAALEGVVKPRADREVVGTVGVEVTGDEGVAEVVVGGLAG